jgi:hypothetical protein
LLVIHCRALLAWSAQIELSPNTIIDFCLKGEVTRNGDFHRIVALARLCPGGDGAASLRLVEIYYRLLITRHISEVLTHDSHHDFEDEMCACAHFAAVVLQERIAGTRQAHQEYPAAR